MILRYVSSPIVVDLHAVSNLVRPLPPILLGEVHSVYVCLRVVHSVDGK